MPPQNKLFGLAGFEPTRVNSAGESLLECTRFLARAIHVFVGQDHHHEDQSVCSTNPG